MTVIVLQETHSTESSIRCFIADLSFCKTILGIEMQNNQCGEKLAAALKGQEIDILINNAGYFYEPVEKIDSLNFEEVTLRSNTFSY